MNTNSLSIRHLRAACEIAKHQSFTLAGKTLHVTQSTLTSTIKQLETQTGICLFDRTTRKVQLTEHGRQFLPIAQKLVSDFDTLISDLQAVANHKVGKVHIAASPSTVSEILPKPMAQFITDYPSILVTLRDASAATIEDAILNNDVDFGIASTHSSHVELNYKPILEDTYGLVSLPNSSATPSNLTPWSNLENLQLIELTADTGINTHLQTVYKQATQARKLSASSPASVAALIKEGLGSCILPALAASTEAFAQLTFSPLSEPSLKRTLYVITRKGRALSPAAEQTMAYIINYIGHAELPPNVAAVNLQHE